ncbi:MAG: hypothetical protein FJW21_06355 [Acidimicrobiia bacterium]|nr:hypothetical protein [Acidimicrobiia bacterium]
MTTLPLDGAEVSVVQTGRTCFGDAVQTNTATRQDTGCDFAITSNTGLGAATTKLAIVYKQRHGGSPQTVRRLKIPITTFRARLPARSAQTVAWMPPSVVPLVSGC